MMNETGSQRRGSRALETALGLVLGLFLVMGVVLPALGWNTDHCISAQLNDSHVQVTTHPRLPEGVGTTTEHPVFAVSIQDQAGVCVQSPNATEHLALVGYRLFLALLWCAVLFVMIRIARTRRVGDPFAPENARRLYLIAAIVAVGGEVYYVVKEWSFHVILTNPAVAAYVEHPPQFSFGPLFAGLMVAVLAEVFRHGAELRADVEGLV